MMRLVPSTGRILGSLRRQCICMMSTERFSDDTLESEGIRRPERGLNRVTLIGRVGREPDHRGTEEQPCIIFPLATNHSFRKADGEFMSRTDWHRICVFKPSARYVANRIGRGDRVFVEGALSYSRFTDDDNRNVTVTSIVADEMLILARKVVVNRTEEGSEGEVD